MILCNSFAFEVFMLCLFYTPPSPKKEGDTTVTINIVGMLISATFTSLICIPTMVSFAWLYEPILFVRFGLWCARPFFCWPCWLGAYCAPSMAQKVGRARERILQRSFTSRRTGSHTAKVQSAPPLCSAAAVGRILALSRADLLAERSE